VYDGFNSFAHIFIACYLTNVTEKLTNKQKNKMTMRSDAVYGLSGTGIYI